MVTVSIIVPIYNVERYLSRCINSLVNQTYKDIEILLINDGSPDCSEKICLEYCKKDNRIRYLLKENGGLSSARNYGIKNAKGKYLYFIDSDDFCEPTLIEDLLNYMEDKEIVACGYCIEYSNNNFIIKKHVKDNPFIDIAEFIYELNMKGMFNVVWNKLYRSEIINKNSIQFNNSAMPGEDLLFNCDYMRFVKKAALVDKLNYHYMREDEVTLVNKYDSLLIDKIEEFISAKEKLYLFLNIKNENSNRDLNNTTIDYTFSCIPNLFRVDCKLTKSEKISQIKRIFLIVRKNRAYKDFEKKDFYKNLFIRNVIFNKPIFSYYFYKFLFIFRYNFSTVYRLFRKFFLFKTKV